MKRKFISAILFGALIVAPACTLVSCSDYDDDISSLNTQTTNLAEQLKQQSDALNAAKQELAAQASAALEAAQKAQTAADAATTPEEAKKIAEEAAQKLAEAAAAQAKAEAIDEAKKYADDLVSKISGGMSQEEINALIKSQLTDVYARISAIEDAKYLTLNDLSDELKKYVTSDNLSETLKGYATSASLTQAIEALKTQYLAVETYNNFINGDFKTLKETVETNKSKWDQTSTDVQKLLNGFDAAKLNETLKTITSSWTELDANVSALKKAVDEGTFNAAQQAAINQLIEAKTAIVRTSVTELKAELLTLFNEELRGLVFSADLYVGGIEAVEYPYLLNVVKAENATAYNGNLTIDGQSVKVAIDKNDANGVAWNYVDGKTSYEGDPVVAVNYHMNPSSAKVNPDALSFISRDVQVINRATSDAGIAYDKSLFSASVDGILTVGVKATGSKLSATGTGKDYTNGKDGASIFALKATVKSGEKDTTIVSDYAMLYASKLTAEAIAYKDPTEAKKCTGAKKLNDELWDTPQTALTNKPTVSIEYTSYANGLDIKGLLVTHHKHESEITSAVDHGALTEEELAKYGLHYEFALVNYQIGDNVTSDSKYASIDKTTGVLTTRVVNSKGESIVPADDKAAAAAVGRHPLIIVRLVNAKGAVIQTGFIKVEIARDIKDETTSVFDKGTSSFNCNGASAEVTWSEVSSEVLSKIGMSNSEFNGLYILAKRSGTNEAKQYVLKNGKYVEATAPDGYYGTVTETTEAAGTMTNKLTWALSNDDQQAVYDKDGHTVTIYVRYERKSNATAFSSVYLPIKVTVTKAAAGALDDGSKIEKWWYAQDGNGAGKASVRINVTEPQSGKTITAVDNYAFGRDLAALFTNSKVVITGRDDVTATKFYLSSSNNSIKFGNLQMSVNNTTVPNHDGEQVADNDANELANILMYNTGAYNNTSLYANGTSVATLAGSKLAFDMSQEKTQQLINSDNRTYANVSVAASNKCNQAVPITNREFRVYFLRPLNVAAATGAEFQDAQGGNASYADVADLLTFSDWRGVGFTGNNGWLYGYYEVKSVTLDSKNITANLNGKFESIETFPGLSIKQVSNSDISITTPTVENSTNILTKVKSCLGKIEVRNSNNTTRDYQVRLPFTITYAWGQISVTVEATVKATLGQGSARK